MSPRQISRKCVVRVLIADNNPEFSADLEELLVNRGYLVKTASGNGPDLMRHARELADAFRPHLAIVDLRIQAPLGQDTGNTDDKDGLKLARDLIGHTKCILFSGYLDLTIVSEATRLGIHEWARKGNPAELLERIEQIARQDCACRKSFKVDPPDAWHPEQIVRFILGPQTNAPITIADDVIGRLFPDENQVTITALDEPSSRSQYINRGRSLMLRARSVNKRQPYIVKMAPAARITQEAKNYDQHIRPNLDGLDYAAILGEPVLFWDLGGIRYTFFGAGARDLPRFSDEYHRRVPTALLVPLRQYFSAVWGELYRAARELRQPLVQAYDRVLKLRWRLTQYSRTENSEPKRNYAGVPVQLSNAVVWLLAHEAESYVPSAKLAITHGDLHADNLFLSASQSWAIDYHRSGPGPILRDFAELEVDIVTRLTPFLTDDLSLLFELATALVKPIRPDEPLMSTTRLQRDQNATQAIEVISGLRSIMREVTRYQEFEEYLWGLLMDALFAALLAPTGSVQRERAMLFASVICARLAPVGQSWPPANWPAMEFVAISVGISQLNASKNPLERNPSVPQIPGPKVLELRDALLDAFSPAEFDDMLLILNINRPQIADFGNQAQNARVVIQYFNARYRIPNLIRAARMANPSHPTLLAEELELGQTGLAVVEYVANTQQPLPSNVELERFIRASNGLKEPRSWREHMARAETTVCRVEVLRPGQDPILGTGFLVAPNVVITNYHVIEQVEQGAIKPSNLQVRFDHAILADGVTPNPGTVYQVDQSEWLLCHSRYSQYDNQTDPVQEPSPDELDFALLRVAGAPGTDPVGGAANTATMAKPRGYLLVPRLTYNFPVNSAIFILQHPEGDGLKLALDTDAVIKCNNNGTRVRYRTNTDEGSSGSPCFNDNWELVALHHAGDPKYEPLYNPQFNQGIPMAAIVAYLEQQGKLQLLPDKAANAT